MINDLNDFLTNRDLMMKKEDLGRLIGPDPEVFRELISLSFSRKMPVCWRATWIMDHLAELHPWLAEEHIHGFWKEISNVHPDGVKRSLLRLLSRYPVPEEFQGIATDLCLEWLTRESVPVAIKAHSMEILKEMALIYPELKSEIITVLKEESPRNSAGFKVRARMIIEALNKE